MSKRYFGYTDVSATAADLESRFVAQNTKALGFFGDSVNDDRAKLNTLVNVTLQPNGGEVDVIGVLRIGSAVAIPSNVKLNFRNGAYLQPDLGVIVTINGTFNRHLEKKFGGGGSVVMGNSTKMPYVNPQWWGGKGDGSDDTTPLLAALGAFSAGGKVALTGGTWSYRRGAGALLADSVVSDNVTITGVGPSTIISALNGAGAVPNNAGNQFYNLIQATGRTGITIKNLAFQGYGCLAYLDSCTDISFERVLVNGLLANAGGFLFDKSIYVHKCSDVRVSRSRFRNTNFAIYLSGDAITQSSDCKITGGNRFENSVAAGAFTAAFPVGVYVFYANDVIVKGNHFKNIYSSVDNGTAGSGMGYGVYEGDGSCTKLTVAHNTFQYDGNGLKNATGIYSDRSFQLIVSGNNLKATGAAAHVVYAIRFGAKIAGTSRTIQGNNLSSDDTSGTRYGIYGSDVDPTVTGTIDISGNTVDKFNWGVTVDSLPFMSTTLAGNTCRYQINAGIQLVSSVNNALRQPRILGNTVVFSGQMGIFLGGYVVGAIIKNNHVLDCNTGNNAGDFYAGISFSTFSFGSEIRNNTIGNTLGGPGLMQFGIANASNVTSRIFKDITSGNTFIGFQNNANHWIRFPTVSPTVNIFDSEYGDFVENTALNAAGIPGWYCVISRVYALIADASSASTTVRVATTGGMLAGDTILICKDANPLDAGEFADVNKWHADTIQSVTNGTDFVLTTGIPAGDGTYTAGTAFLKLARHKAAAAIAA